MENYNISVLVGEGSFGKVYKATDRKTKNTVALKILSKVKASLTAATELLTFPFVAERSQSKGLETTE